MLSLLGLEEARYRLIEEQPTGIRQRAKLAQALINDPDLVILDEPTNGLDPAGRSAMLELISRLHREQGKSILLSSHLLGDVERVCDSVVILDRGRVLAHGEVSELTSSRVNSYRIQVTGSVETCEAVLNARGVELEALPARPGGPPRDFIAVLPGGTATSLLFAAFAAAFLRMISLMSTVSPPAGATGAALAAGFFLPFFFFFRLFLEPPSAAAPYLPSL